MKERILSYMASIDRFLEHPPADTDWNQAIHDHLIQVGFFQHERLIHLIVTVLFALMTVSVLIGFVDTHDIWLGILLVPIFILLVPYISHYYLLENGVQKMYRQYDGMLQYRDHAQQASDDTNA